MREVETSEVKRRGIVVDDVEASRPSLLSPKGAQRLRRSRRGALGYLLAVCLGVLLGLVLQSPIGSTECATPGGPPDSMPSAVAPLARQAHAGSLRSSKAKKARSSFDVEVWGPPPTRWEQVSPSRSFIGCLSAPAHKSRIRRLVVRESYRRMPLWRSRWNYAFFVGRTANQTENALLQAEAAEYGDIVMLNLTDSYDGLPEKVFMMIEWIRLRADADFIIKSDDDTFIRLDLLPTLLDERAARFPGHIHCWVFHEGALGLDRCSGMMYAISKAAAEKLMTLAREAWPNLIRPAIASHFEDIEVTGYMAKNAGVQIDAVGNEAGHAWLPLPEWNFVQWSYCENSAYAVHYVKPHGWPVLTDNVLAGRLLCHNYEADGIEMGEKSYSSTTPASR